ncbi:hypothetical protein CPC16_007163 [Podila verticillata]|nr:hypothetical protein BGZ52_004825 [Haplosporangium bisporale]KAF9387230.1 hypothetical protein CPC16_007163 [Podila verticillata]KAI9233781.1 MAG: hypothetical protein BYD32DRAFT_425102 [Podila humilis]KFH71614.1 hypothetical protein MVEG_01911 [Podila verticillata NRRL 6337]
MKFLLSYVFAAMLVFMAVGMAEARSCQCQGCGFHMNVSRRSCSEGSNLGWRWDSLKAHCWDITQAETTRYGTHCRRKGCDGYICY